MDRLKEQLEKVSKPNVELPLHQARLRRALMGKFEGRPNIFSMTFSKLLPAGLALAMVLSFGSAFLKAEEKITPSVSAAEIINSAMEKVQSLSAEELEEIRQKMNLPSDHEILATLKDAKSANDLSIVTPEIISCEVAETFADSGKPVITVEDSTDTNCVNASYFHFGADNYSAEGFNFISTTSDDSTYLEYTKDGVRNVIGFDEENLPVLTINYTPFEDISGEEHQGMGGAVAN